MEMTFGEALKLAAEKSGRSLRSIATDAGVSYDIIKNLAQGKARRTNFDDARKIVDALGVSMESFLSGKIDDDSADLVAVAGRVGAGAQVPLVDGHEKGGGLFHVLCPPQISPRGVVAVEVEGNSMSPAYEPGDVLFYSRLTDGVPTEAIGKRCVVLDSDGDAWVKLVKRRDDQPEGLFDLHSINAEVPPRYDVEIRWAAPVRMHLNQDLLTRVEA